MFITYKITYRNVLVFKRVIFVFSSLVQVEVFLLLPKDVVTLVPWVSWRFFLRAAGIFCVGQRPKLRAAEPREKKLFPRMVLEDMTETGNRARKVSGRQGIILVLVK